MTLLSTALAIIVSQKAHPCPHSALQNLRGRNLEATCGFNEELYTFQYDAGEACHGFGVTVGVDPMSNPKIGSHFPEGFVDLAAWKTDHKEATLICMPAKGYSTKYEIDEEAGTETRTSNGHALFFLSEPIYFAPGVDLKTNTLYWMQGGTEKSVSSGCTYDPDTTQ